MKNRNKVFTTRCIEEGCTKCEHSPYSSRKEYQELFNRSKTHRCLRHKKPNEALSSDNLTIVTEMINTRSTTNGELIWADRDGKLSSGFQHGTGFRVWSNDFDEGVILRVTAEIVNVKK